MFLKPHNKPPSPETILKSFSALVAEIGMFANSEAILPAPKKDIKKAILAKLAEEISPISMRVLVYSYTKLSMFQSLSAVEKVRIQGFLTTIGAMWAQRGEIDQDQKQKLSMLFGLDDVYGKVVDKIHREENLLRTELVNAGFLSEDEWKAEAQSSADQANLAAKKMGMTMTLAAEDFLPAQRVDHAQS